MNTTVKSIPRDKHTDRQISKDEFIADFGESKYLLHFESGAQLTITVLQGAGKNQTIGCRRVMIRPEVYMVTWQETDGSTVTHLEDFENGIGYTNTTLPDMTFQNDKGSLRPAGTAAVIKPAHREAVQKSNTDIVTEFLDLAFNRNDATGAAALVTERYVQHNPFVADGRDGFIEGIAGFHKAFPDLSWKPKHIYTDGNFVVAHSLYRKDGDYSTVDIFRLQDGKIDKHWDVTQKIPSQEESANRNTMF